MKTTKLQEYEKMLKLANSEIKEWQKFKDILLKKISRLKNENIKTKPSK
jgi:hypothetical protein